MPVCRKCGHRKADHRLEVKGWYGGKIFWPGGKITEAQNGTVICAGPGSCQYGYTRPMSQPGCYCYWDSESEAAEPVEASEVLGRREEVQRQEEVEGEQNANH